VKASEKPRSQILKEARFTELQLSRLVRGGAGLTLQRLEKLAEALGLEIRVRRRSKKAPFLGELVEILGLSV
jgi:hypothetical protein